MRSLILLWVPLWLVYLGVGAVVSGFGFRHLDLSYTSLCAALLIPLIQSVFLLAAGRFLNKGAPPGSLGKSSRIRPSVTAILVANFIALQVLWLTAGTSVESTFQQLILHHLLAIQLGAVALAVVVNALARGRSRRDNIIAAAIALPAAVAAAELLADPIAGIVNAVGLSPMLISLAAPLLGLIFFAGLIANASRFQALPIAGRLADWGLGAFFGGAIIWTLITHGGAQLGPWWLRLLGTCALICTSLVTAALIQARHEMPVHGRTVPNMIWWTAPATRLAMLGALIATYLGGWLLLNSMLGATPPLEGEWGLRAAAIPTVQAGFLVLVETLKRRA